MHRSRSRSSCIDLCRTNQAPLEFPFQTPIATKVWTHVACTYDVGHHLIQLYVNGLVDTSFHEVMHIAQALAQPAHHTFTIGGFLDATTTPPQPQHQHHHHRYPYHLIIDDLAFHMTAMRPDHVISVPFEARSYSLSCVYR
jgi:hypothetical protein